MSLDQLPREIAPPSTLEERTVARLRDERLVQADAHLWSAHRRPSVWWQAIAAGVIFAAGAALGAAWNASREVAPLQPRFLLLLHGATTDSAGDEQDAVAAYRRWAIGLRDDGRFVAGERLAPEATVVPSGPAPEDAVEGYFIVSAADLTDATTIARSMPHVERGGRVVVRRIDTPQ
jgi:hypothetical protein